MPRGTAALALLALVSLLALPMVSPALAQGADGVTVVTDSDSYRSGEPIGVTITNGGPDRITRGGLDCDQLWPLALEQLQDDGSWQTVPAPSRGGCIGITGVITPPGATQSHTISLPLDPGTYHVAYSFNVLGGAQLTAYSDPFEVISVSC